MILTFAFCLDDFNLMSFSVRGFQNTIFSIKYLTQNLIGPLISDRHL